MSPTRRLATFAPPALLGGSVLPRVPVALGLAVQAVLAVPGRTVRAPGAADREAVTR
jgi:hypothetical protein